MQLICCLNQFEEKIKKFMFTNKPLNFFCDKISKKWRALHKAKVALWWKIAVHTLKISIIRILSNGGNQIEIIDIDFAQ